MSWVEIIAITTKNSLNENYSHLDKVTA